MFMGDTDKDVEELDIRVRDLGPFDGELGDLKLPCTLGKLREELESSRVEKAVDRCADALHEKMIKSVDS